MMNLQMTQLRKEKLLEKEHVDGFIKNPNFLHAEKEEKHESTFYPDYEYKDVKWGMAMDHK